jgi:hypothetical protein
MHKLTRLAVLFAVIMAAPLIYAASVHFKGGNPDFSDQGVTLKTCFSLSGLGNQDVTITIKAAGFATTTCTNKGGNEAPGQNKTPISSTAQETIPSTQIKNGNLSVCLTTSVPPAPSATDAGCPNGNWTTSLEDVQFTSAEVIVMQGGKVVLDKTFSL